MEDELPLPASRSSGQFVRGMESVIATVSGYHGLERFKLIKLINSTGASYVGAMSKSTTHLVCWRLEGKKYELAKSFGTKIVSHRWFEDCLKAGKRLPERHYMMKSGQQAGNLSWVVPVAEKEKPSVASRKVTALADLSNTWKATREIEMNAECIWPNSHLLSENLSPATRSKENSRRSGNSGICKHLKHPTRVDNQEPLVESSSSGLVGMQHGESSSVSVRQKRNVCSTVEDFTNVEPTRKGRRLVKKNACRSILEPAMLDPEQEIPSNLRNKNALVMLDSKESCPPAGTDNITDAHIDLDCLVNENTSDSQLRNSEDSFDTRENRNEMMEDAECITDINMSHAANNGNPLEEITEGTRLADGNLKIATGPSTSTEPSCVICWTNFSSTRGVLPCGHRFCYPCIQSWADHMGLRRKVATCPLCKANFSSITKVDDAASSDQKIYSQTIPCHTSASDIFALPDWNISDFRPQSSAASVCCECRSREPEDLLISCHICSSRLVHSYCLDPPLIPWTCNNCRDLRMLYQRNYYL